MNRVSKVLIAALSLATGCLWLNMAHAASFDCAKAGNKVEKLICADPFISKLDGQLGKVYDEDIAKAKAKQKKRLVTEELDWLKGVRDRCTTQACLKQAYMQRLVELKAFDGSHSPKRKILGHYAAFPVTVGPNPFPIASVCRPLVANFNQFRDVPFESNNPRLSPKYPQFRRPDWKPMAWNPTLAEMVYSGCANKACLNKNGWRQPWHYWAKTTKPLRAAHKTLLWRAQVDLLGDGRHETLIRLTHYFPPNYVRGKLAPAPIPRPYSRYIDSRLYMLPSHYPKMANAFNYGPRPGWGVFGTDLIHVAGNKATPYLSLAWTRGVPRRGIGVSAFESADGTRNEYFFYAMCNIAWIHGGE